jgi:hypothetical protein
MSALRPKRTSRSWRKCLFLSPSLMPKRETKGIRLLAQRRCCSLEHTLQFCNGSLALRVPAQLCDLSTRPRFTSALYRLLLFRQLSCISCAGRPERRDSTASVRSTSYRLYSVQAGHLDLYPCIEFDIFETSWRRPMRTTNSRIHSRPSADSSCSPVWAFYCDIVEQSVSCSQQGSPPRSRTITDVNLGRLCQTAFDNVPAILARELTSLVSSQPTLSHGSAPPRTQSLGLRSGCGVQRARPPISERTHPCARLGLNESITLGGIEPFDCALSQLLHFSNVRRWSRQPIRWPSHRRRCSSDRQ